MQLMQPRTRRPADSTGGGRLSAVRFTHMSRTTHHPPTPRRPTRR